MLSSMTTAAAQPIRFPAGNPSRVGYARVSTADQSLDLQLDALRDAGCGIVFTDYASGATKTRPGLDAALAHLRRGDTIAVWRLDRLGRSTSHLISTVENLREEGVAFRSLTEGMDTSTSGGQMIYSVFAAMAQFERDVISERTKAGLDAAKARGRKGGRRPSMTPAQIDAAREMQTKGKTLEDIAAVLKVSRSSVYRHLKAQAETA